MHIGEAAKRLGVSVRTLHHYDALGLVKPTAVTQAGYRQYDRAALARLQAVLFYKELGFKLKDIARLLDQPGFDLDHSLRAHRELLVLKRQRLEEMISMVDATIERKTMKPIKTTLEDIREAKRRYAAEAEARWGHTEAYAASQANQRTEQQDLQAAQGADALFAAFAACVGQDPASAQVQALVKRWQDHITQHHYPCTQEILAALGEMYTQDERFTQSLDRFGAGTAQLMRDAIRIYCGT